MGNAQKDTGPVVQQVTPSEIRSFIMIPRIDLVYPEIKESTQ